MRLAIRSPALPAAVLALLSASPVPAGAASEPFGLPHFDLPSGGRYPYVVVDQDLRDVLRELGGNLRVPVQVSDGVAGRVRGQWPEMSAREFLDRLADGYALQWFWDGQVLHVSAAREAASRLLPLGRVDPASLQRALDDLHVADRRYPLRASPVAGVALVSGPPAYVAMVQQVLGALQRGGEIAATTIVRGRTAGRAEP